MPTGKKLRVFKGHTRRIESVAWSPDGSQLATGSQDKTVKVWDVATGKELHTFSGASGRNCSFTGSIFLHRPESLQLPDPTIASVTRHDECLQAAL